MLHRIELKTFDAQNDRHINNISNTLASKYDEKILIKLSDQEVGRTIFTVHQEYS